jgi:hypothetical protein
MGGEVSKISAPPLEFPPERFEEGAVRQMHEFHRMPAAADRDDLSDGQFSDDIAIRA